MRFARWRDLGLVSILALASGGCDRTPESNGTVTVVAAKPLAASATPPAPPPSPVPSIVETPTPGHDVIVRGTQPPPIDPSAPPVQLYGRARTFVDPPLPPELLDDGGLIPLPPRETPSGVQNDNSKKRRE